VKLHGVVKGERFVFGKEGGVWEKMADNKARCVWGPEKGAIVDTEPNIYVYGLLDKKGKKAPAPVRQVDTGQGVTIILEDAEEVVLRRIENAPAVVVAAYANTELVRFIPDGKNAPKEFMVKDVGFDQEKMSLHIMVLGSDE
jgi:hypothetical protein